MADSGGSTILTMAKLISSAIVATCGYHVAQGTAHNISLYDWYDMIDDIYVDMVPITNFSKIPSKFPTYGDLRGL